MSIWKQIIERFRGRGIVRVVLDTNVIVAAVTHPEGAAGRILQRTLSRDGIRAYISETIMEEYRFVLRPFEFALRNQGGSERFLAELFHSLKTVSPRSAISRIKNDPTDNKFLECALEAGAEYIITSDRHFNFREFRGIRIVNAGKLCRLLSI